MNGNGLRDQFDADLKHNTKGFLYWDSRTPFDRIRFTTDSIGNGGYAHIYLAEAGDGEKLALKFFLNKHGVHCSENMVNRIKRNLCANLESGVLLTKHFVKPKIIPDYGSGPWYLMEYFEGGSVGQMMTLYPEIGKQGEFAGTVLAAYADMLSFIHQRGLIFQDNSWGNVLFNGSEVKICDYDLMYSAGGEPVNAGFGTPIYGSRCGRLQGK